MILKIEIAEGTMREWFENDDEASLSAAVRQTIYASVIGAQDFEYFIKYQLTPFPLSLPRSLGSMQSACLTVFKPLSKGLSLFIRWDDFGTNYDVELDVEKVSEVQEFPGLPGWGSNG